MFWLLVFVAETPMYPGSSLTSSEQFLRAIWDHLSQAEDLSFVCQIKHNSQLLGCAFFSPPSQHEFNSVTRSCLTLCDPINCSTPGLLSITSSWRLPKHMSIELVMPSTHLILCCPLLLLLSIFPNIKVFSNESALHIRWPKYWSFSFNISPSKEYSGLISLQHLN